MKHTIRELRLSKNWSQMQLAVGLGVSTGSIHMWEKGKSTPTIDSLRKVAALFNVSLDDIELVEHEE